MPQSVSIVFWLTVAILPTGIILTIVSWVKDSERLERLGIRVSLIGLLLLIITFGTCTAVLLDGF